LLNFNMQIENYIKELLYDYSKVIIPGLGAFLTADKSAYIVENEGKIHPPTKNIIFNDNIKLDDGVLITKIREEEGLSKEKSIESIQAYIEQLLAKLNADRTYTIDDLGTFVKEEGEYKLHFKQTDEVNYLSDIFNLPVIDLPKKITTQQQIIEEKTKEVDGEEENEAFENPHESDNNEILAELTQAQEPHFPKDEVFENPHESDNNEILAELTQAQEPHFPEDEALIDDTFEIEEQEEVDLVEAAEIENPYQDNEEVNEYIATSRAIEEESLRSKGRIWWFLIPLLLLGGLAFGLYNLFLKDSETTIDDKPALQQQQKPVEVEKQKPLEKSTTKIKETGETISSNSTAALLQGNKKRTDKPNKAKPVDDDKPSSVKKLNEDEFYNGYYIIISSFVKEKDAQKYSQDLRKMGYNAVVLPNSNKYNRVSIYAGKTKADAEKVLPKYKEQLNKDAWALKFKNE